MNKTPDSLRALADEVERKHSPIASEMMECVSPDNIRSHADQWDADIIEWCDVIVERDTLRERIEELLWILTSGGY